jgi:hypothetical protein
MLNRLSNNKRKTRKTDQIPLLALMKQQNTILRDLTTLTMTRAPPSVRDVQPIRRPSRPAVHTFEVTVDKGFVSVTNGVTTGALVFALSDLPSPTDFTSLFDQYRIKQVRVEFLPETTAFGLSTTAIALPYVLTAIDYDDGTPVSTSAIQQYGTCQTSPYTEYFQRILNPRAALAAYSGAFTSYAQSPPGQWMDSNSPGIQYYGLKWATTPVTVVSGTYDVMSIVCHYTIQCRNNI